MSIKIRQRDITDCGAACLASVSAYYKLQISVSRIRQIAGTDTKGTNVSGMVIAAEKLGFNAKGVRGAKDSLQRIPLPAIAHIIVDGKLSHYVVIYKVRGGNVQYMDPLDGNINKVSVDDFCKTWTGVLIILMPGDNFHEENQKVSNLRRFSYLLKPHRSILIQCLFGALIYTILGLSISIYIQKITDTILPEGNVNLLNLLSLVMLCLLFLQVFINYSQSIFMLKTGQQIDTRLILGYYKHLLRLPQRFFDTMRVGEIISRVNDAVKIRVFINDVSISLIVNVLIVIFSFSLMFIYNWKLALTMLGVLPLYFFLYMVADKLNKKYERKLMERSADLESQLVESINSVKTIKQFGIEEFTNLKTENRFVEMMQTGYRSAINSIFIGETSGTISQLFIIILLWAGSYYVIGGTLTPGELLSFYAIMGYFSGPAASLVGANKVIQNALIASDRLFEIMDLERESEENTMSLKEENLGDIRFENVSFAYGTRKNVFSGLTLSIPKGKITAVIGESGSGKTTLAVLLQKLYPIKDGKITINGQSINYFTNESIRKIIGTVPQQLNLFAGSIVENIAVGEFNPDIERILSIIEELGLKAFIEGLPDGINTRIGENGLDLSGGERQRLAIARAIYRNPSIIIFDEATSALDTESESHVKQAMIRLKEQGKTVIIIAHRLNLVLDADKIIVLENGTLLEEGTHKTLYHPKTRYYSMWKQSSFKGENL